MKAIASPGGAATSPDNTVRSRRNSPNQEQSVIVYDLISEGPIEGLIDGASSIYLDTTQVLNNSYKCERIGAIPAPPPIYNISASLSCMKNSP